MIDPFRLDGRIALVTGATGGIGAATVALLASAGASLVLTSNDADKCEAMAADLCAGGTAAWAIPAELSDQVSVREMAQRALELAGRIDVLICNAGMEGHVGPIGEATLPAIETLLHVNLISAMTLTSALVPQMAATGKGSIVFVASIAGLRGNKVIGQYGVSKAALAQLGRNLAVEWGPQGVRANTIAPGLTRTPFAKPLLENADVLPRRLSLTPLRRAGEPDEIAAGILFLASDAAGFVTGHTLVVDGGTTISDGN